MIKAKYTIVLKTLLDDPEVKALIDKAMSSYPLYEKKSPEKFIPSVVPTRSELNEKILNYYKYREIGFETVGRFLDELETALKEIMPYYNQLLFTLDQDYNILYNVDYDKEVQTKREGSRAADTQGTSGNVSDTITTDHSENTSTAHDVGHTENTAADRAKTVHTDTPQNALNLPDKTRIEDVKYADSVQWNDHETTGTTNVTGDTEGHTEITQNGTSKTTDSGSTSLVESGTHEDTEEMHERIFGNYGQMSYQYLVAKYRELIMNVEQRIINDRRIQELFMLVY